MALIGPNFVFIHVPKTGGMFFRKVIHDLGIPYRETGDPEERNGVRRHHSIERIPESVRKDKLVFGFVRHPVTWLRSKWAHVMRTRHRALAIPRFKAGERTVRAMVRKRFTKYINLVLQYCPTAPTEEMLAFLGNARIYRSEEIDTVAHNLLTELGYKVPRGFVAGLGARNRGRTSIAYAPGQATKVVEANAEFCERFGYL